MLLISDHSGNVPLPWCLCNAARLCTALRNASAQIVNSHVASQSALTGLGTRPEAFPILSAGFLLILIFLSLHI